MKTLVLVHIKSTQTSCGYLGTTCTFSRTTFQLKHMSHKCKMEAKTQDTWVKS